MSKPGQEPFELPSFGVPDSVIHVDISDNVAVRDLMDDGESGLLGTAICGR